MAGKITALEPQKQSRDRVNVYLEGAFAFGLAEITAARLTVGAWLTDAEIASLLEADGLERAREKALSYLSYRPRSTAELGSYLSERGFSEDVVSAVLSRLGEVGLLDDEAFARSWLENRLLLRPKGRRALSAELQQKGIPAEISERILESFDEASVIRQVAEEQARRLSHLPPDVFRRRLTARLSSRGFAYDLIQETLSDLQAPQLSFESESEEY